MSKALLIGLACVLVIVGVLVLNFLLNINNKIKNYFHKIEGLSYYLESKKTHIKSRFYFSFEEKIIHYLKASSFKRTKTLIYIIGIGLITLILLGLFIIFKYLF